jgi:hypothetical protein
MTEPVRKDHIRRENVPWRTTDDALTECGLDVRDCQALTPQAMLEKIAEQGEVRASLSSCMTCWQHRRTDRGQLLRDAVSRLINRSWHGKESGRVERELRAIGLLVAAHREEFETTLRDMDEAVDIRTARKKPPAQNFGGLKL